MHEKEENIKDIIGSFTEKLAKKITIKNERSVPESSQKIAPGPENAFKGQCLSFFSSDRAIENTLLGKTSIRDDGSVVEKFYQVLEQKDIIEKSIILSCGFGGGATVKRLCYSFEPFVKLFGEENRHRMAIYSPQTEGKRAEERYKNAAKYYDDENYILEESAYYFDQIFKPRFFNPEKNVLKDPAEVQPLLLGNFSIGCRETKSHLNYLYDRLKEAVEKNKKTDKRLEQHLYDYFDKIYVLNIGGPINWSNPSKAGVKGIKTKMINFLYLNDRGTARPESLMNAVYYNHYFQMGLNKSLRNEDGYEGVFVFGSEMISEHEKSLSSDPEGKKDNLLGHDLNQYVKAMKQTVFRDDGNLQRNVNNFLDGMDSVHIVDVHKKVLMTDKYYDPSRVPSQQEKQRLHHAWSIAEEKRIGLELLDKLAGLSIESFEAKQIYREEIKRIGNNYKLR